jgi:hypothetical protein
VGSISVKVAIQYAAVTPEEPEDWADVGTAETTATVLYQSIDLAAQSPEDRYYFRLGVAAKSGSDVNSRAAVKLSATTNVSGAHLGGKTINTTWGSTSTTVYNSLTGWYPAQVVDKVKAAYSITSQSGLKYALGYRTMNNNLEPAAWGEWETTWTSPQTDNSRRNSGELSEPTAGALDNKLYVQFGLGYIASSSTCTGVVQTEVSVVEK